MTGSGNLCPICGARLVPEPRAPNATVGECTWLRRCENQHWWLQSLVFGWIPITPDVMAVDRSTMMAGASRGP
jgi:hypothetical protein